MVFEVLDQRQDHALILVVLREAQGAEVRQTVDVMDVAAEITLHLQRARPGLEGEHRLPVEPEVGGPERIGQDVRDLLVLKLALGRDEQLGECHCAGAVQRELAVGVRVLAAVDRGAAKRIVGVMLVQPVVFVQHRDAGRLDRGHVAEHIPHALEVIVHLSAAAHIEALSNILSAVAAAARKLQLLKQMNALTLHLSVADKIEGGGKTGETGADDISRFSVHTLRLFGVCKGFVSTCGIIHSGYLRVLFFSL